MVESQPNRDTGRVFVGRQREMAELTSALVDALSGQGRLVMLAGEPGIGKTRTAQELAGLAEQRGTKVLWGWCYEEEGAPPYWPWVQTIRSYVQSRDAEQIRTEMGHGAANIAEIVPDMHGKLTGLDAPALLEPEQARFRLFDSITSFLKNASQSQPLMLVLDDLHWADKSSLLLLQFLARELAPAQSGPLLVVGCYRDAELSRQHPLSETLAQLSRSAGGGFQRVLLRGLDQISTTELIEAGTGIVPTTGLVEALYSHTEGNPFFMTEIIRLLSESGELTAEYVGTPGGLRIPEGVREVIGQRLNRLSEQCNQALGIGSLVGREFDFRLLNSLIGQGSEDRVLEALEEALAAGVIEEPLGTTGRYQFTHALIQETLAQELSTTRRARLHARIGLALEELYSGNVEVHAAELAHHFTQSEAVTGPDKLVLYSLIAGDRALASHGYEDAITHFERGLVTRDISLSGTEPASNEEAAALLFGLARAQSATMERHQEAGAFTTLSRAFEYYAEAGNIAQAVAAAEFPIATQGTRIPGVSILMDRALALVPPDSHEAGRLQSRYGGILGAIDYEGAQRALEQALGIARREGDVVLEVQTLTYAAAVSGQHLHWQDSLDYALQAIKLASNDGNPLSGMLPRWWSATSLLRMGRIDAARPQVMAFLDLAESPTAPRLLASNGYATITTMSVLEGDWEAGRRYSDRGLEVSPLNPQLLLPRVLLEHETGEFALGEVYLERLIEAMGRAGPDQFFASGRTSMAIAAISRITGSTNRLETAGSAAEAVLSEPSVTPIFAINATTALALLAVETGNSSAAEDYYDDLLGYKGTMIWTVASVDRLLGLLSHTMNNLDQAADHFEDSLALCRKAGYRPELVWTCHDYAGTLLQRDGPDDRAKAIALLDESLSISTELGMLPLMTRVAALQEKAVSQAPTTPVYPDGLTEREVEVLRLVAAGKSNPEIGEELFISPRTVTTHVSNILNKINSANRAEATGYAVRQGLV